MEENEILSEDENKMSTDSESASDNENDNKTKKTRRRLPFPTIPYDEATEIANAIWKYAAGQKIRRLTLFNHIGKSPDSGHSRALVTLSSKYGITTGGYSADYIELTEIGAKATNPDLDIKTRLKAQFELCITNFELFRKLYEQYKDAKLPSLNVMADFLVEQGLPRNECSQCIDTFILNCKYLNILQVYAGSERILNYDHWIELIAPNSNSTNSEDNIEELEQVVVSATPSNFEDICFFIAPIGEENSDERLHSDLFLNQIVEPALKDLNLKVIRADSINKAGLITAQIIDLLKKAKLVVADLSFHNPNVFYELAFRHTLNLPTIHIIRKADSIPFDLNDFRTITIDDTSIYTLVPQLDTFKRQITSQAKTLFENTNDVKNPISSALKL